MTNALMPVLAIGMPGQGEIIILLFVILLLFGGRKLPELARALGRSLSEFKKGREEEPKDSPSAEGGHDGNGPPKIQS